jgi:hypothetical protein
MGQLDETRFEAAVRGGCPACGAAALEIRSFIDRRLDIMLGDPNNDGRWVHDGEKFIDGTYRISCASCGHVAFADDACPRCHAAGGLARALGDLGDPGYHLVAYACESCDAAVVTQTCPLCDAPGPLRPRP